MSPIPQFRIADDFGSPLGRNWVRACAVQQAEVGWRRGGKGTNAVNAVVLSPDLTRRAALQQRRFERGLAVDTCEENKLKVSLHPESEGIWQWRRR